jgi:diguanylate cyclase (GGDEF)-like protein
MADSTNKGTREFTSWLLQALGRLHGAEDAWEVMPAFTADVHQLLDAVAVLWWNWDPRTERLKLQAASGHSVDQTGLEHAPEGDFLAAVLAEPGPQILEGESLVRELPPEIDAGTEVRSVLGVRVGSAERPHGVLLALFAQGGSLAVGLTGLFELLAGALSRAWNASLMRRELRSQVERFLLLHDLSRILQSEDPIEQRLHRLMESLTTAFQARLGYVMIHDPVSDVLEFRAAIGIGLEELQRFRIHPGEGITGRAFTSGHPLLVPDVSQDPDYIEGQAEVCSEMAVPVRAGDQVIGVLNFESDLPDGFDEDDLRLAVIISAQLGSTLQHALAYDEARNRLKELELLNRVTRIVADTEDLDELFRVLVREIRQTFQMTGVGILIRDPDSATLTVKAADGESDAGVADLQLELGKGLTGVAAATGETQYAPDVTRDPRYIPADPRIRSELAVPLMNKDEVVGVLNLESSALGAFPEEDRRVAEIVAAQIAQLLTRSLLYERMATMAITDGLTGLFNHRHFFERLESEFKRSVRYAYPLSLIMVDIDFFKEFNDAGGHLAGDVALKKIAELITESVRETDVVSRYGGEEFAVILPLCHESTAEEVAQRIRATIEQAGLRGREDAPPLTVSIGISTAPQNATTHEELVRRADDAMYASKHQGRNRCTLWTPQLRSES